MGPLRLPILARRGSPPYSGRGQDPGATTTTMTDPTLESKARAALGRLGVPIAVGGVYVFTAFSAVSIVAYQVGWILSLLGLLFAFGLGRIRYRATPLDLAWLLFVCAEMVSVLFSVDRARSLRSLRGEWILLFFPVFLQALRDSKVARRSMGVLIVSSSISCVYAIWQVFVGRDLVRSRPLEQIGGLHIATGFFGHHLTYGGHVLITGTIALALFLGVRSPGQRILHAAALLLQLGGVVGSFARTAWIGFIAATGGIAVLRRGRARWVALAIGLLSIAIVLAVPAVRQRLQAVGDFTDDPRRRLWATSLRIWLDHPVFGSGLGSFRIQFPLHKVPGAYLSTAHPHNDILNIMVNAGIVGLAGFVFFWIRFFRWVGSAYRRLPCDDPRRPLLSAGMMVAGAVLVGGLGQCFFTDEEVGTLIWFTLAATAAVAREVHDEGP